MNKKIMIPLMGLALATLIGCTDGGVTPPSGNMQAVTPDVQDLVGARGSSGENALQARGFDWVKTEKSGGSSYTYWKHNQSGQCISVRTEDGRYASLTNTMPYDCTKK